jgi:hypothetical protein
MESHCNGDLAGNDAAMVFEMTDSDLAFLPTALVDVAYRGLLLMLLLMLISPSAILPMAK